MIQKHHSAPKREPLSRLWFMSRGYEPIDPSLVFGRIFYIRVKGMDVSILDAYGRSGYIVIKPNEKGAKNHRNINRYYYLRFGVDGRTRDIPIALLVMATYNHKIPDRPKGEVIDHIDGNTFNNNPRNLRIVSRAINDRDGGFMRKLRNHGIQVEIFPGIILEGYKRMAQWKATHTRWQYQCLEKDELLRIFVGPKFSVVDPNYLMDPDINRHYDPFIEKNYHFSTPKE